MQSPLPRRQREGTFVLPKLQFTRERTKVVLKKKLSSGHKQSNKQDVLPGMPARGRNVTAEENNKSPLDKKVCFA